mgnify:CR=1 FL=1
MDVKQLDPILENRGSEPYEIMEALQDIQDLYGYLPEHALRLTADSLGVPLIEVFRLANFYKAFSLTPRGRHLITVCTGTACHVRGTPRLLDDIMARLDVRPGETTVDQAFTLETVNCLGACALGPVVVIDGVYYEHMDPSKLEVLLETVRQKDEELVAHG